MAGKPGRGGAVAAIAGAGRTLGAAVDAFLSVSRPDTTARTYAGTMEHLAARLGRDRPLADVTDGELADAVQELWGHLAPRTWNRHLATVRSFLSWCREHGWPAGGLYLAADRKPAAADDSKAIPLHELERLWTKKDIPLRERALWRLLYDSASRAEAVLGLDVPDLDLANRQARARVKGGHVHLLHFQTGAARLLAKLIAGRESGPVFLTDRRAASHRVTAPADLDPETGRARLSYEMAGQLFKDATKGRTLHQLRHSRLTHLGDANVSAPLLMTISGHKQLATLQQYVKPSQEAVAKLMADTDPARRRK
ncbi:MAG: tyrosine-type recombinase/integrase [Streptosporangiaceae bacterium]